MSVELNPALLAPGAIGSPPASPAVQRPATGGTGPSGPSFADVLEDAGRTSGHGVGGTLSFSKHALERVRRRGIQLDPTTLGRLQDGVGRAAGKGSRDSIVLVDGTAFVVSVNNRTVITAVGSEHMREHVFTNIDSAVIA
ncbi:MAG: TIGR02530 family flagellar biosynthesis protein [Solirubrobacteraceae bacterium]